MQESDRYGGVRSAQRMQEEDGDKVTGEHCRSPRAHDEKGQREREEPKALVVEVERGLGHWSMLLLLLVQEVCERRKREWDDDCKLDSGVSVSRRSMSVCPSTYHAVAHTPVGQGPLNNLTGDHEVDKVRRRQHAVPHPASPQRRQVGYDNLENNLETRRCRRLRSLSACRRHTLSSLRRAFAPQTAWACCAPWHSRPARGNRSQQ